MYRLAAILGCLVVVLARDAPAHNVPVQLPEPQSAAEAWNVIEESAANVDKLFDQGLARDITFQLANSATALQWLGAKAEGKDASETKGLAERIIVTASQMLGAIQSRSEPLEKSKQSWRTYRATLVEFERHFP